ncbi:helix-turn-helix transcriptional regulator [Paraburkholderia sp. GAS32]|uniref:helix-turn-helix transcriptional regulator n=1 Tax=Paraburkholderia sp. GAS32 TaxID=3035129 RepID=UPI003D1CE8F7
MPMSSQSPPDRNGISRMRAVIRRTGLSKTSLSRPIKIGAFPSPVRLSHHCIGFRDSEVDHWIATRPRTKEIHT